MPHLPLLLALGLLGQPPADPPAKKDAAPAAATQGTDTAKPGDPKADAKAPAKDDKAGKEEKEQDTPTDKLLKAEIAKLDKLAAITAEFDLATRFQDQEFKTHGVLKLADKGRFRFELENKMSGMSGKRQFVNDGAVAYRYDQVGDEKVLVMYNWDQVQPLLDTKDFNNDERQALLSMFQLPALTPGLMLRGLTETYTFDSKKDATVAGRPAVEYGGKWRKSALGLMQAKSIEDLRGDTPQYVTVALDKATSFPLLVTQYRKDDVGIQKAAMRMEFTKFATQAPPDADFRFTPPQGVQAQNQTQVLVGRLTTIRQNKKAAAAAPAAGGTTPPPPPPPPGQ